MMSNSNLQMSQSVGSSATYTGNERGRLVGIRTPNFCWCGHSVVELKSKSNRNPGRMFYRCSYAADNKLMNDDHIFKWVDEVTGSQNEPTDFRSKRLEEELMQVKKMMTESKEYERKKLDQIAAEVEERLTERIDVAILDAKRRIWKTFSFSAITGISIIVCLAKLFG